MQKSSQLDSPAPTASTTTTTTATTKRKQSENNILTDRNNNDNIISACSQQSQHKNQQQSYPTRSRSQSQQQPTTQAYFTNSFRPPSKFFEDSTSKRASIIDANMASQQENTTRHPSSFRHSTSAITTPMVATASTSTGTQLAQTQPNTATTSTPTPTTSTTTSTAAGILAVDQQNRSNSNIDALQDEVATLKRSLENEKFRLDDVPFATVAAKLDPIASLAIKSRRLLKGHNGKALCLDWAQDKRRLVSSSQDGKLIVWDAFPNNSKQEHVVTLPTTWVMACSFAPSGNFIAGGGLDNKITTYPLYADEDSTLKKRPIGTHTSYMSCCQFLGNDQQILTGSGDSTCALWNVECGSLIQSFHGHTADVLSLDVSPSETGGNTFVSVGCDRRALIWDTRVGHCGQNQYIQSFKAHVADINAVKFYPSGDSIVTGSDDTTCRLYDLRADREVAVYQKDSILFGINSVDLSISGRILFAGGNDYSIHVWDALRCVRICILYGHENRVSCVRVSSDGTALASSSWDHTIRVWA